MKNSKTNIEKFRPESHFYDGRISFAEKVNRNDYKIKEVYN